MNGTKLTFHAFFSACQTNMIYCLFIVCSITFQVLLKINGQVYPYSNVTYRIVKESYITVAYGCDVKPFNIITFY